jgi:hypothetical protein
MIISGIKKIIKNIIEKVKDARDYDELRTLIQNIYDLCLLGGDTHDFQELLSIGGEIPMLEAEKSKCYKSLANMYDSIVIAPYHVENIDQLCISLDQYDLTYQESFLKMYDMIWQESLSDCPLKYRETFKPYAKICEELGLKYVGILESFNDHFRTTYEETLRAVNIDDSIGIVTVSDKFIEHLCDVELNLFVNVCEMVADHQMTRMIKGKSSRIHFNELFNAIITIRPRNGYFSNLQKYILEYVLKTSKDINEEERSML